MKNLTLSRLQQIAIGVMGTLLVALVTAQAQNPGFLQARLLASEGLMPTRSLIENNLRSADRSLRRLTGLPVRQAGLPTEAVPQIIERRPVQITPAETTPPVLTLPPAEIEPVLTMPPAEAPSAPAEEVRPTETTPPDTETQPAEDLRPASEYKPVERDCGQEPKEAVCGTDNVTYTNACLAELLNVEVAHRGECPPVVRTTTTITDTCKDYGGPKVCGTDAVTYDNYCYAQKARGVYVKYEGECKAGETPKAPVTETESKPEFSPDTAKRYLDKEVALWLTGEQAIYDQYAPQNDPLFRFRSRARLLLNTVNGQIGAMESVLARQDMKRFDEMNKHLKELMRDTEKELAKMRQESSGETALDQQPYKEIKKDVPAYEDKKEVREPQDKPDGQDRPDETPRWVPGDTIRVIPAPATTDNEDVKQKMQERQREKMEERRKELKEERQREMEKRQLEKEERQNERERQRAEWERERQNFQESVVQEDVRGVSDRVLGLVNEEAAGDVVRNLKQHGHIVNRILENVEPDMEEQAARTLEAVSYIPEEHQEDLLNQKADILKQIQELNALRQQLTTLRGRVADELNSLQDEVAGYNFVGSAGTEIRSEIEQFVAHAGDLNQTEVQREVRRLQSKARETMTEARKDKFRKGIIPFKDTDDNQWVTRYAAKAKELGCVKGTGVSGGTELDPGRPANVAEAITAFRCVIGEESSPRPASRFGRSLPAWSHGVAATFEKRGVDLDAIFGNSRPEDPATRGQMARLLQAGFSLSAGSEPSEFGDLNEANTDEQKAISAVEAAGIMTGYDAPERQLTGAARPARRFGVRDVVQRDALTKILSVSHERLGGGRNFGTTPDYRKGRNFGTTPDYRNSGKNLGTTPDYRKRGVGNNFGTTPDYRGGGENFGTTPDY